MSIARSLVVAALAAAAPGHRDSGGSPPRRAPAETAPTRIFDAQGGLADGWEDLGWAPRTAVKGSPARIDFSNRAGWILTRPGLEGSFSALTFRMRAPATHGTFLGVGLDSSVARFPLVHVDPKDGKPSADGFLVYRVAMRDLNPDNRPFDRVLFRAHADVSPEPVLLDDIALIAGTSTGAAIATRPARNARVRIQCGSSQPISPYIYGVAGGDAEWRDLRPAARRWGGNANTRYNWEIGYAWNAGNDWFFRNVNYGTSTQKVWADFLDDGRRNNVPTALTVPTIGWVAKDTQSYSFPVSLLGPQRAVDPDDRDIGNGVALDGSLLPPLSPTRTSVPATPTFIARWVAAIRERDGTGPRSVLHYILDNEPTLWDVTHRDVHPEPVTYNELLERTISYATAIRRADPHATIAGPAEWGWTGYFYSASDLRGVGGLHLDRLAHGNKPLLPWWLGAVRAQEKKTGRRLIDLVDVHFYPANGRIGTGVKGGTDADTAALRIRSTRALWDPTYVDESWINEPVQLLPRLRDWIDENAPGVGISIGEWNFGGEKHMSGGLAVAEALGRFGEQGVTSAFYWTSPPAGSPAALAFRAYRNFDGKGGRFLDRSLQTRVQGDRLSAFASRDEKSSHLVAVLLNLDSSAPAQVAVELNGCGALTSRRAFVYDGGSGFAPATGESGGGLAQRLPPYSITVLDLSLAPPPPER